MSDDQWNKIVYSWSLEETNNLSVPQIDNFEEGSTSNCLYLHNNSNKGYFLSITSQNSVCKYPVELKVITTFKEINTLREKYKTTRLFLCYDGVYYSGKISRNTRSDKKMYPFVFNYDDTCKQKIKSLDDIRVQVIRIGRRKRKREICE